MPKGFTLWSETVRAMLTRSKRRTLAQRALLRALFKAGSWRETLPTPASSCKPPANFLCASSSMAR
eukprot:4848982-Amphidinium_carterae.1